MNRLLAASQTCLVLLACSSASPAASPPPAAKTPALERSTRYARPAAARVVAIGDLHGDLAAALRALRMAGAIDEAGHWSGGQLIVVQTGDVIDRGDDDRAVLDLLDRLRSEATRAGGALIALSGNHEVMNVQGDLRYVSAKSAEAFEQGRAAAFAPSSAYARRLADWPIVAKVGDSVFVHGGVLPKHVRYGIDRLNEETAAWMRGERAIPEILLAEDAPIWTRLYSAAPDDSACVELSQALRELGAARMVVGHTPQPRGIAAACSGKVWRIDTGMSRSYGGPVQVLELTGDRVSVNFGAN
ncbi:MAG TPA: metallophosphoesterase [Polyangiales bacterium]|nr:metallophosphoesterase [Polyangiales bacterium]